MDINDLKSGTIAFNYNAEEKSNVIIFTLDANETIEISCLFSNLNDIEKAFTYAGKAFKRYLKVR